MLESQSPATSTSYEGSQVEDLLRDATSMIEELEKRFETVTGLLADEEKVANQLQIEHQLQTETFFLAEEQQRDRAEKAETQHRDLRSCWETADF
jgi:hypothetical protein